MKNINKIILTIEFGKCSVDTKEQILNTVKNDIDWLDETTMKSNTFNYMTWEEQITHKLNYSKD